MTKSPGAFDYIISSLVRPQLGLCECVWSAALSYNDRHTAQWAGIDGKVGGAVPLLANRKLPRDPRLWPA